MFSPDQSGTDLFGELAETLGHSLEDLQQSEADLKMCEWKVNVPRSDLKVSDNFDLVRFIGQPHLHITRAESIDSVPH